MDYPGNSHQEREAKQAENAEEKPDVSSDLVGTVTMRKPSLAKRFRNTFLGGESLGTALMNVFTDTLIPSTRDMIVEGGIQILERTIQGDARRGPVSTRRRGLGYTPYNKVATPSVLNTGSREVRREISSAARANHDFRELDFNNRGDAEGVLERLRDVIDRYGQVAISDLYSMVNLRGNHVDDRWGWVNLRDASVQRERSGMYILNLPRPEQLDL